MSLNRTILITVLYSANCFMIVLTSERIRYVLGLELQLSNLYRKCLLGFEFSLLGLSAFTLISLNNLINEDIKRIGR